MDLDRTTAADPLLAASDIPPSRLSEILSYWKRAGVYYALNKPQVDLSVFQGHAYVDRQWCHRSRIPIKFWSGLQNELKLELEGPQDLLFAPLCAVHTSHAAEANPPLLIPFWIKVRVTPEGAWDIPDNTSCWIPPIFLSTVSATYPIFGDMTAFENYLLVQDPMSGLTMNSIDGMVNALFKSLTNNELEQRLSQSGYQLINEALLLHPILIGEQAKELEMNLSSLQNELGSSLLNKLISFDDEFREPPSHSVVDLSRQTLVEQLCSDKKLPSLMSVQYSGGDGLEAWMVRTLGHRWVHSLNQSKPLSSVGVLVSSQEQATFVAESLNHHFPWFSTQDDEWTTKENFQAMMNTLREGVGILKALDNLHDPEADEPEDSLTLEHEAFNEDDTLLEEEFDKLAQARLVWDTRLARPTLLERIGLKKRERQARLEQFIVEYLPAQGQWFANETLFAQITARQRAIRVARTKIHRSLIPLTQNMIQNNALHLKWNNWQNAHLGRASLLLADATLDAIESIRVEAMQALEEEFAAKLIHLARGCDVAAASLPWSIKSHALGWIVQQASQEPLEEIIVLQPEKISPLALAPFYQTLQRLTVVGEDRDEHYYHMLPPSLDIRVMQEVLGAFSEEMEEYYGQTLSLSRGNLWELCRQEASCIGQLNSTRALLAPLSRRKANLPVFESIGTWPVLALLDTQGHSQAWAGSYRNFQEAQSLVQWLDVHGTAIEAMLEEAQLPKTMLITTPYAAQAEIIRQLIQPSRLSVRVESIAQSFEGASVVLYSSVHTGADKRPFCQDEGLAVLNKVLLLAHHALWVIGDKECFNAAEHSPSGLLGARLFMDTAQVLPSATSTQELFVSPKVIEEPFSDEFSVIEEA